jgi:hypothetical protein
MRVGFLCELLAFVLYIVQANIPMLTVHVRVALNSSLKIQNFADVWKQVISTNK